MLIAPAPKAEEAAAVVAALERFMRATATVPGAPTEALDGWQLAALEEAVEPLEPEPWINA